MNIDKFRDEYAAQDNRMTAWPICAQVVRYGYPEHPVLATFLLTSQAEAYIKTCNLNSSELWVYINHIKDPGVVLTLSALGFKTEG